MKQEQIHDKDNEGDTALTYAARNEIGDALRCSDALLVNAGTDEDSHDHDDHHYDDYDKAALMHATSGFSKTISRLIEAGANIHDRSHMGATALMLAAGGGSYNIVARLIEAGSLSLIFAPERILMIKIIMIEPFLYMLLRLVTLILCHFLLKKGLIFIFSSFHGETYYYKKTVYLLVIYLQ